jgi:hypothetical protein
MAETVQVSRQFPVVGCRLSVFTVSHPRAEDLAWLKRLRTSSLRAFIYVIVVLPVRVAFLGSLQAQVSRCQW